MTLNLLDLLLVVSFGFDKHFPTWMWILAFVDSFSRGLNIQAVIKAIESKK